MSKNRKISRAQQLHIAQINIHLYIGKQFFFKSLQIMLGYLMHCKENILKAILIRILVTYILTYAERANYIVACLS